ncbi:MAG TPA: N-acetyl sugar amidotransferase [Bacteroidia bacterium]|nr:N-acetyl sugar amidotransferase [Bacteroidia bacterium]
MKVAIIELDHFQYGLTQSEIFDGHEKIFFVSQNIKKEMTDYNPGLCNGTFHIVESLETNADQIIKTCNSESIDLLMVSPVFSGFEALLKIAQNIKSQKVITIHNVNFWLNSRFRTPAALKERKLKQEIVKCFDYIAVEDFIYHHLKTNNAKLFSEHKFIYIPFTIFQSNKTRIHQKENDTLKVVLPGSIHKDRRRYEEVIEVITNFAKQGAEITFSFAGKPLEAYGKWVISQLENANALKPGIASYFPVNSENMPLKFLKEMETSDLVLSTSTTEFKALGTTEYIGKTKPTAAIHDMISFQLPGLLPQHLHIPENLAGSVFNYKNAEELQSILQSLISNPAKLKLWKDQAIKNSQYFTVKEIRKNLPFFYNQCKRCVMDNINDPDIWFDKNGNCNYCNDYYKFIETEKTKKDFDSEKLKPLFSKIKKEGANKKYDCLVGVSGGADSMYVVHLLVQAGLRPLVVHYDNGWNSETAVKNIEVMLNKLNIDLHTYINEWEEFKDIQLAFIKASVIDIELVTDQAIIASLYKLSRKHHLKYVFTGHNTSTEFILPKHWYHWKLDGLNIKAIHRKFGKKKISTYPIITYFDQYYLNKTKKIEMYSLLNYVKYNKAEAKEILKKEYGWIDYTGKHNESVFTRFFQNYILPLKFQVDKRKAHLSSLICSGQLTREEALEELKKHPWETAETLEDKDYVIKKLGLTMEEFDAWIKEKPVSHLKYPSYLTRHDKIIRFIKNQLGR